MIAENAWNNLHNRYVNEAIKIRFIKVAPLKITMEEYEAIKNHNDYLNEYILYLLGGYSEAEWIVESQNI
jgi:hypothetical protein